jgi:hypothetical protein
MSTRVSRQALDRAQELAYRRMKLRAQCATQRKQLGESLVAMEAELAGIDRAVRIARRFVTKPALVATGVALLTFIGPKRALRWVTQGAFWYSTGAKVAKALAAHKAISSGQATPQPVGRNLFRQSR